MSTALVRYGHELAMPEPKDADTVIEEVRLAKRQLTLVDPGPAVAARIEEVRRCFLDFVNRLSEHARLALHNVSRYGETTYNNAFGLVSAKMQQFHNAGRDLLSTTLQRSSDAYTDVDRDRIVEDLRPKLGALSIGVGAAVGGTPNEENIEVGARAFFGTVQRTVIRTSKKPEAFVDRFLKACTQGDADYLVLYVLPVDDPQKRKEAVTIVVDRVLASLPDATLSPEDKAKLVSTIDTFLTSVREGKNPYTLSVGEGVLSGTLPEVVPLDVSRPAGSLRTWIRERAQAVRNLPGNRRNVSGPSGMPSLPYPPLVEASPQYLEGVMLLYWNNGEVDENRLEDASSIDDLVAEIEAAHKSRPGMQCVGAYFYDKHALEKTLLLLPRGSRVRMQLQGTGKICSIVRKEDGSLAIDDLFGNPPRELIGVTQEEILRAPYTYFSVRRVSLDVE